MDGPIKFFLPLNGKQYNEIEYYLDRNTGEFSFKVNSERSEQMMGGPPPLVPPEFKRSGIMNDFGGKIKSTVFELFDNKE